MAESDTTENTRQLSGQLLLLAWFVLAIGLRDNWFESLPSPSTILAHLSQVAKYFR